jgi:5-methyltetrahydropteroyltriglutamate--homocysteine methyltransferase
MAVLGLVTTKSGCRETQAELSERIDEASRYLPRERLAISPQCGFATSVMGNRLTVDDERYKLRLVAETARRIWPDG